MEKGQQNSIYNDIVTERHRQDKKWGYPQENTYAEWGNIIAEEVGELCKELNELNFGRGDRTAMVTEAVQVAAVAVSIVEHFEVAAMVTKDYSAMKSACAAVDAENERLRSENTALHNYYKSIKSGNFLEDVTKLNAELESILQLPSNDPLTLGELQTMIGLPVYMLHMENLDKSGWCIVEKHYDDSIDLFFPDNTFYAHAIRSGIVQVYRNKPEESLR